METRIEDIGIDRDGRLTMTIHQSKEEPREIWYTLPERFVPQNDLIALTASTLLGEKFDRISFDLPITGRTRENISEICSAEVVAPTLQMPRSARANSSVCLNFSGGFDSLAAKELLDWAEVNLVSLDFGGKFEREANFFKQFDTTIISTNFRSQGLAGNSWTFMGAGALLLRDHFEASCNSFGSIIEASPWTMRAKRYGHDAAPVFRSAGFTQANPVAGLTEAGTALIAWNAYPDLAEDSLNSLAARDSEKYHRKALLLDIVSEGQFSSEGAGPSGGQPGVNFGTSYVSDFLSLYILKKRGEEAASNYIANIPSEVSDFVGTRPMLFFEKFSPLFYEKLPRGTRQKIYSRLLDFGIEPYSENDWADFRDTVTFLSTWHKLLE